MDLKKYEKSLKELMKRGMTSKDIAFQLGCEVKDVMEAVLAHDGTDTSIEPIAHVTTYINRKPGKPKGSTNSQSKKGKATQSQSNRMDIMREKYRAEYRGQPLSTATAKSDPEYVEKILDSISLDFDKLQSSIEKKKREELFIRIMKSFNAFEPYEISIDNCDYLSRILSDRSIQSFANDCLINKFGRDYIFNAKKIINSRRNHILLKMASEANTSKELTRILRLYGKEESTTIYDGGTLEKIERKRQALFQAESRRNYYNNIGIEVDTVLCDVASGSITEEEFERFVVNATQRRMEKAGTSRNRKIEDERKQVIKNIRVLLAELGKRYKIEDVEAFKEFYLRFLDVSSQGEAGYMNMVVANMLANHQYDEAKAFCSKYTDVEITTGTQFELAKQAEGVKKKIELKRAGTTFLNRLNNKKSDEDDEIFLKSFELSLLNQGVSKLTDIKLGKNNTGTKDITLFDIWYDERARLNFGNKSEGR